MDLRLLSAQHHISNEQKQLFRLSAPLCPQNCMPYQGGEGLYNPNGGNNHMNTRNGSKSNDHFNHINEVTALLETPENAINKSKSNMDIRSYHQLQQIGMNNHALHSNCTSDKCTFNGQIINCAKYCPKSKNILRSEEKDLLTKPNIFRTPIPKQQVDNIKNSKFIYS